jgi:hypothetical protein
MDQPYYHIARTQNRCGRVDVRELLKQEIYKQGNDTTALPVGTTRPAENSVSNAPQQSPSQQSVVGFEDYEFYFDSVSRDSSSDLTIGELKWSITTLNNSNDIKNIIELRCGNIYFPKIHTDNTRPDYFYYQRVFMELTTAPSSQAVLGPNYNKFHFEFKVSNLSGQAVELTPVKEVFYFQRPILNLTEFNIRFMIPSHAKLNSWKRIPIPPDRITVVSLTNGGVGYNPIRFRVINETTATMMPIGVLPAPGLAVFFDTFASSSSALNSAVLEPLGNYVTNIISDTDFEIAGIDGSVIVDNVQAGMYIPKNRIAFPMRFTSVREQRTNYVTATHN